MNFTQAIVRCKQVLQTLALPLLFSIDLIRISGLFVLLTVRFAGRTYLHFLTGMPEIPRPSMEFYACRPIFLAKAWDDKLRFMVRHTWTLRILGFYCGSINLNLDAPETGGEEACKINFTTKKYLRLALYLGLTWTVWVGVPLAVWKIVVDFPQNRVHVAEFNRSAGQLYENGEFDRARIQYLNAIQLKPSDLTAQWGLAQCARQLGNVREAHAALDAVLALQASNNVARAALVDLLLQQMAPDQALAPAALAVQLDPTDADARVRLGACLRLLARPKDARQQAEKALQLVPEYTQALLLAAAAAADAADCPAARQYLDRVLLSVPEEKLDRLAVARVLSQCQEYAAAQNQIEKVLADQPSSLPAAKALAELEFATGDLVGAIGKYMVLDQILPQDPSVRIRLAELLLSAGRLNDAHTIGEALVRQIPGGPAGPLVLGSVYYLKGLLSASAEQCRACLQRDPQSVAGRTLLARVLMRQQKFKEAASELRILLAADWKNLETQLMLAECQLVLKNRTETLALLENAMRLHPKSEAPHLMLARLYESEGAVGKTIATYRKALELNPKQPLALNNLAALLSSRDSGPEQNLAEALTLATSAWSLSPDNPEIGETLGWIYALSGKYPSAFYLLSFSARQLPRNPLIRYHLAYVLTGLNRTEEATSQLDYAEELSPALANSLEFKALRETLRTPNEANAKSP